MGEKITGKYLTDRLYRLQMILKDNSDMMDEAGAEIIILRRKITTLHAKNKRMAVEIEAWRSGRLSINHDENDEPFFLLQHTETPLADDFDLADDAVDALMAEREE